MDNFKKIENDFFNALVKGNRIECREVMRVFRESNLSIIILYEQIFKNSLYRLGKLWEYNKISVAVEHMATSITEGLMNELLPDIVNADRINKQIVISCVENEQHQVGVRMVADIFEKNCWDTHFLGANTPTVELVKICTELNPDIICLSLSVYENVQFLVKGILAVRAVTNAPIIIGGHALLTIGVALSKKYKDVIYLSSLDDIENFIRGCV